jgi:hypothetical protein
MKDARSNLENHSPGRNRARRHAAGLVAEYIHELWGGQRRSPRAGEVAAPAAGGDRERPAVAPC